MKYCSHCGKEIADEAVVCIGCGCSAVSIKKQDKKDNVKYCVYCGKEINENAVVCTNCGCAVVGYNKSFKKSSASKILYTIAKVLLFITIGVYVLSTVVSLISFASPLFYFMGYAITHGVLIKITLFSVIPLAWIIPMTVAFCRKVSRKEPISIAFKVCTLLFVNIIAGILMLCAIDEN